MRCEHTWLPHNGHERCIWCHERRAVATESAVDVLVAIFKAMGATVRT